MDRRAAADSALAAVLGAVGAVLRKLELNTALDAEGLPLAWQPATIALLALSAVVICLFVLRARRFRAAKAPEAPAVLFGVGCTPLLLARLVAAAALAAGSALYFMGSSGAQAVSVAGLGLLSAAGCAVFALAVHGGKSSGGLAAAAALPVVFLCAWLVFEYRARSADPVLIDYMYDFLAICSSVLAAYYSAGFLFGSPRPMQSLFLSRIAAYFCILCAANATSGLAQALFFSASALRLLADAYAVQARLE